MSEIQKHITKLRKQLLMIDNNMKQLMEISKSIPNGTVLMKPICDAQQKNIKNALKIMEEISKLVKNNG